MRDHAVKRLPTGARRATRCWKSSRTARLSSARDRSFVGRSAEQELWATALTAEPPPFAVLWLLGQKGQSEDKVTDEEIKMLVAEAEHHGTIESDERRMIAGVMRLGDRAVDGRPTTLHPPRGTRGVSRTKARLRDHPVRGRAHHSPDHGASELGDRRRVLV